MFVALPRRETDANKKPKGLGGEYQVAGANRRYRCGCNPRRESAVAQLFSLGSKTRIDFMKTNTVQKIETFKISSLIPMFSLVVFLLMFYSLRLSVVLGALLFTALICSSPAIFRTRGGSLVPAIFLAALGWLSAVVVFVLSY